MKKNVFKTIALAMIAVFMFMPFITVRAEEKVEVTNEEELVAALENGGEIVLKNDIAVTKPLHVSSDVTIYGEDKVLSADPSFTRDATGNGSLITVGSGVTATFMDMEITNNATNSKYGVQAYNTGVAVFAGVTIHDCKWGAILVNGGGIGVIDLTLNDNSWGIEFGQGTGVTENPGIVMEGSINGNQEKLFWLAENDDLEKVVFGNFNDSEMKISIEGKTLVLKDSEGNTVATSNELAKEIELVEEKVEEDEPTVTPTPEKPETNPDTADMNVIAMVGLAIVGFAGIAFATRKIVRVR